MAKARKTKRTRRRAPRKKAASQRSKRPAAVAADDASAARQAKLFRAVARALKEEGVVNQLVTIHLKPAKRAFKPARRAFKPAKRAAARARVAAAAAPAGCPPGQVARVVCFRKPNGTVVCERQCQPI